MLLKIITKNIFGWLYFSYQVIILNFFFRNRNIIISDIDNTLSHTYPCINKGGLKIHYRNLSYFPLVKEYILLRKDKSNAKMFFLSVRPIGVFFKTASWLKKVGFEGVNPVNLFFVTSPTQKISLLKKIINKKRKILFIDDFSYNTENGETFFFQNEIDAVSSLNVEYIGYHQVKAMQETVQNF
ncbi:MAG: hypothetical protein LH615_06255 [Ferruginibacter sp.]|nr:hypothetical protein [Ferruginibacter sp.]